MRRTPIIEANITEMLIIWSVGRENIIIIGSSMVLLTGADKMLEFT